MEEKPTKIWLEPPESFRLIYVMAGFSCIIVTLFNLKLWPPVLPSVIFSLLVLAVGWWKVLFWNPVIAVLISPTNTTLLLRRGGPIELRRANLASITEFRFGKAIKNTGIRFTLRSGETFETGALNEPTRRRVEEEIVSVLNLNPCDYSGTLKSWTV